MKLRAKFQRRIPPLCSLDVQEQIHWFELKQFSAKQKVCVLAYGFTSRKKDERHTFLPSGVCVYGWITTSIENGKCIVDDIVQWSNRPNSSLLFSIHRFTQRLPSVNLEEMNREQLVKIFKNYASPIPKRSSGTLPLANGKEQHNQLAAGQHSVQLKRKPETNLEKSTDLCKKRKYSNDKVADATTANRKRQHNGDVPMVRFGIAIAVLDEHNL